MSVLMYNDEGVKVARFCRCATLFESNKVEWAKEVCGCFQWLSNQRVVAKFFKSSL